MSSGSTSICSICWLCFLLPVSLHGAASSEPIVKQGYSYAFASYGAGSVDSFDCIKHWQKVETAFVRAYTPDAGGSLDPNLANNVHAAEQNELKLQFFVQLNASDNAPGGIQVQQALCSFYGQANVVEPVKEKTYNMWLLVQEGPDLWSDVSIRNIRFLLSALQEFRQWKLNPGVMTSANDWAHITNNLRGVGDDVILYYWDVSPGGSKMDAPPNFTDFKPFADFAVPQAKQFNSNVDGCGQRSDFVAYSALSPYFAEDFRIGEEDRRNIIERNLEKCVVERNV